MNWFFNAKFRANTDVVTEKDRSVDVCWHGVFESDSKHFLQKSCP